MPKFKIVVDDEEMAHRANQYAYRLHPKAKIDGLEKRPKGTVHTEMDSDCPEGLPNCRNCGDPVHETSCRAQGHCPQCGTAHGIAPESRLAENGYKLEAAD